MVFNGFKTVIRTKGNTFGFDELITMLNGEDFDQRFNYYCSSTTYL